MPTTITVASMLPPSSRRCPHFFAIAFASYAKRTHPRTAQGTAQRRSLTVGRDFVDEIPSPEFASFVSNAVFARRREAFSLRNEASARDSLLAAFAAVELCRNSGLSIEAKRRFCYNWRNGCVECKYFRLNGLRQAVLPSSAAERIFFGQVAGGGFCRASGVYFFEEEFVCLRMMC